MELCKKSILHASIPTQRLTHRLFRCERTTTPRKKSIQTHALLLFFRQSSLHFMIATSALCFNFSQKTFH